jgi:pimeloyl-ACP methyl ester carboxylesterase
VARRAADEDGERRGVRIVGHSYGGLLALRAAARGDLDLRALAAYEPVAFGVLLGREDATSVEARADLARLGDQAFAPELDGTETWLRMFVDYWQGTGGWDAMNAPARKRFSAAAHKTFHEVNALRLDQTPSSIYFEVRAPVLLVRGAETTLAEKGTIAALAEMLANVTVEVVPGAGHLGPLTHARDVNTRIVSFLDSTR